MTDSDKQYIDAYFAARRTKETVRMIIALAAMALGLCLASFAEPVAADLGVRDRLISILGMVIQLAGFGLLTMWIFDGKEYVFPRKRSGGE